MYEYTGRTTAMSPTSALAAGSTLAKCKGVTVKVFYVMGKALSYCVRGQVLFFFYFCFFSVAEYVIS